MPIIPLQTARKQLQEYIDKYFTNPKDVSLHFGIPSGHIDYFLQTGGKPSVALQRALGTKYLVRTEYYLCTEDDGPFLPPYTPEEWVTEDTLRNIIGEKTVSHPQGIVGCARDLRLSPSYLYSVRSTKRPISNAIALALGYQRKGNSGPSRMLYKKIDTISPTPQEQTP
jgi:hypothetical protein